ncbi:MAG: tRNA (adenosine(37)-N6)-dimethylallyltransferase MiaA [Lachnospiraceae bacterium]|nr:tRNA (adenosine(37)-N6)-dimethylallyltransferase MiaA [Lachnospiraceae bacterium]
MNTGKKPFVILTGPTAVGKTAVSLALAKAIGGEIISADSMQVYRCMDIGSAKITTNEMLGIPHYLVDVLEPEEDFNVVKFQTLAKKALAEIYAKGKIPIVVGGTGFYIQALLYDIDFSKGNDDVRYRQELEGMATHQGAIYLHDMLAKVDAESAQSIHANNIKKVIRALEFYKVTGKKISEHNAIEREKISPYNFVYFVLNDVRSHLYEKINQRVDRMLADGLLAEVNSLKERGFTKDMVSMQGLGYKEMLGFLDGTYTLEEAIYMLKRDTRHFAKRQITWFKREKDVIWLNQQDFAYEKTRILKEMQKHLKNKQIL